MTTLHSASQTQSLHAPGEPRESGSPLIPVLSSVHLLGTTGEAVIEHAGQLYRLPHTDRS